jgi:hypothetical protein
MDIAIEIPAFMILKVYIWINYGAVADQIRFAYWRDVSGVMPKPAIYLLG